MRHNVLLFLALSLSAAASYGAYVTAPAVTGDIYRILYIHVPSAWVCYLSFSISLLASILFLIQRKGAYDITAEISAILGLVFGAVALLSGSIWANAAWGSYWNWDPRETTTLILWIAYIGYISIKLSIEDTERKKVIGAVYNILAFFTIPLSYLSITLIPTLHPQIISAAGISLTMPILITLLVSLTAATILFIYLLCLASTVWSLERRVNALILEQEEKSGSTENA